jgi:hypothetical protein
MQGLVFKAAARGYVSASWSAPLLVRAAFVLGTVALATSCGDDDAVTDAGTDAGDDDAGDFIRPRRDAQVGRDPIPECDRFDPLACGAGQRCQVVIRRAAAETQFLIYAGCIENVEARGLGDPCEPWGGASLLHQAPGLEDEVYVDPCGAGLFCAPDRQVRGSFTCQRACQSGRYMGFPRSGCSSATAFCAGPPQSPYEETCRESDRCDPSSAEGCGPGTGCYLRLNDAQNGVLTVCLPAVDMPRADGEACMFLNDCSPGSSCWGPTRVPPSRWETLACRRSCLTDAVPDADAGLSDEDAGTVTTGAPGCRAGQECVGFQGSGLDLSGVSPALGQCE